jgi:hypothetical protein
MIVNHVEIQATSMLASCMYLGGRFFDRGRKFYTPLCADIFLEQSLSFRHSISERSSLFVRTAYKSGAGCIKLLITF